MDDFPYSSKPCLSLSTMESARYSGPSRKLVVALDIGTTFSGAAYALLDPIVTPDSPD